MNSFALVRTLGLLALLTPAAPAQVPITPVGLTGLTAPGNTGGAQFNSFGGAALNSSGQVAFQATLYGVGVGSQNDTGIWAGALPPVVAAREDNRPPGTASGVQFASFDDPVLGPGGHVSFRAMIRGLGVSTPSDAGIWAGLPTGLQLAARKGGVPPGIGNVSVQFASLGLPAVNGSGAVAFYGTMIGLGIGDQNNAGIWAGTPGALQLAARKGSVPPGIGNASVQFLTLGPPAISSSGNVAFNATVIGLGIGEQNNSGIWAGPVGEPTLAAREGNRPMDTSAGVMFDSFDNVVINGGNQIAFGAALIGLGVSDQNNSGIWAGAPGALRMIAREGNVPPGTSSTVQFEKFGPPVLNPAGQVAFKAKMRGSVNLETREGIWSGAATAPTLLARAGNSAPGAGNDVNFLSFGDPVFTGAGTVAFAAKLTGVDVAPWNDAGIWVVDSGGLLRLVVREGQSLDGGDISREISRDGLKLFPQQGGDAAIAASTVQVLFKASFIDGTNGLFRATVGAPRIESITQNASGGLQLQFDGVAGLVYAVESTTDIATGNWKILAEPIRGTGARVTVTDNAGLTQPARVYRVRILPAR